MTSIASLALVTGAFAQSSQGRTAAVRAPAPNAQATEISTLCGVNYAITDPDANIRLELRRNCAAGIEGGAD
jgi:hypothetical protein